MNNNKDNLEQFFNPENINISLKFISLYIAVYENFKSTIVNNVKYFYWSGIKDGKEQFENYENEVLNKSQNKKNRTLRGTLQWLKDNNAINEEEHLLFEKITDRRNQLAHNMSELILNGLEADIIDLFTDMIKLFEKIEKWWIKEIEIPISGDFTVKEYENIDWDGVTSLNLTMLKIMSDIALRNTDEYLKILKKN